MFTVSFCSLKMSIGGTDARTDGPLTFLLGRAPGLFSPDVHNKYEVDGSLATDDAYFANGQTTRFNGTRWGIWYQLAGSYKFTFIISAGHHCLSRLTSTYRQQLTNTMGLCPSLGMGKCGLCRSALVVIKVDEGQRCSKLCSSCRIEFRLGNVGL